jgi:PPK2 family polyphosphate:nucleotide phosphotransferase
LSKITLDEYRVREGAAVSLARWPTNVKPLYRSGKDYRERLERHAERLRELQPVLYADARYSLLVIFQAMDAAGKDGAIKHVMSGVNPQGTQVVSFRHPGPEVLAHDFLWNAARHLPERGRIGIFNRSYYEEVLIVRVHPRLLAAQKVPIADGDFDAIWTSRYESIRNFERHLHASGTRVVKFFLHLSREEQRKRLLARLEEQHKNWKFDENDLEQRSHWTEYMAAYEACLSATSLDDCPWYIVPADDKRNCRLIVSRVIIETLSALPIAYPQLTPERHQRLHQFKAALAKRPRAQILRPRSSS